MLPVTRRSDVVLAVLVLTISMMLLVPLPTVVLDFLITINLSLSLLLLLVGLFTANPSTLLSFPALLLLSTLFRLALNVASSRLILTQGEAGQVIAAFGNLLIRGEIAVGIIIFIIITVVNFIVIARGAYRVSEVTARFALDSLPGKQMAIDADLRSGSLSPDQAKRKREELTQESQLYGSMDGAMRFVQGDAIAGVFIIFANILGGLYMGIRNSMPMDTALDTYTKLTVGDALVSQIPALLVSICAGIVVTRVSSSEQSTLGLDVSLQVFSKPIAIQITGLIVCFLGLLPGLPWLPFLVTGASFIAFAYWIQRPSNRDPQKGGGLLDYGGGALPLLIGRSGDEETKGEQDLVIELDSIILSRLYRNHSSHYQSWWNELQNDFFTTLGVKLPEVQIADSTSLSPGSFQVSVRGVVILQGVVPTDSLMVETKPEHASVLGLIVQKEEFHPLTGQIVFWTHQSATTRKLLESAEIRYFEFFEYIGIRIAEFFRRNPEDVLSLTDIYSLIRNLEKRYPGLVDEAIDKMIVDTARLTDLSQELVRAGIGIRDFKQVVESVATFCSYHRAKGIQEAPHLEELVSFVRQGRKRQLVSWLCPVSDRIKTIALSPDVEESFEEGAIESDFDRPSFEPEVMAKLREGLLKVVDVFRSDGVWPIVVVCRSEIRGKVTAFLRWVDVPEEVISFDELPALTKVERVGVWRL